jgi:hypothetical protein
MIRLLSLSMLLGLASGCGARELAAPSASDEVPVVVAPATHRPVPRPPQLSRAEPVLWVALEDHLGSHPAAMPLQLSSAGAPLTLEDGAGGSWTAASFTVRWRSVALPEPVTLARRIAGPFREFRIGGALGPALASARGDGVCGPSQRLGGLGSSGFDCSRRNPGAGVDASCSCHG